MKDIALQLYSVKDFTEKDFTGTIKKIVEFGYKGVEFAGYGGLSATDLNKLLLETGLTAHASHFGDTHLIQNIDAETVYAKTAGIKTIVCSYANISTREDTLNLSEEFNKIIKKCKANGLGFAYHNHAHEFNMDNNEFLLDILFDNTPELDMELDVYWVAFAGINVIDYMKKFKNRLPLIHLKEIAKDKSNVDIGTGILDFAEIVKTARDLGTRCFIVEQERYDVDSMTSAKNNVEYLSGL